MATQNIQAYNKMIEELRSAAKLGMMMMTMMMTMINKANLSDLIAATSLIILIKLDSNRQFFSP